jgi:hypothetical protein
MARLILNEEEQAQPILVFRPCLLTSRYYARAFGRYRSSDPTHHILKSQNSFSLDELCSASSIPLVKVKRCKTSLIRSNSMLATHPLQWLFEATGAGMILLSLWNHTRFHLSFIFVESLSIFDSYLLVNRLIVLWLCKGILWISVESPGWCW